MFHTICAFFREGITGTAPLRRCNDPRNTYRPNYLTRILAIGAVQRSLGVRWELQKHKRTNPVQRMNQTRLTGVPALLHTAFSHFWTPVHAELRRVGHDPSWILVKVINVTYWKINMGQRNNLIIT